ncbi:MAG: M1 family metallopeptidase [Gemmatimonadaceae bacterium]|nr:M1 family metallopeptidase [Chitinophagaceae bacterium]
MRKVFFAAFFSIYAISAIAQANNTRGALIDIKQYEYHLTLNDADNSIKGKAVISVRFLKGANNFELDLAKKNKEGKGMTVLNVLENKSPVTFTHDRDILRINTFAKEGEQISYTVEYEGVPADGLVIDKNKYGERSFFGDNWPDRAHQWLPCVDHPADKAAVEWNITAPEKYQVIANGILIEESNLPGQKKLTRWKETVELPTKVMVIGVASFSVSHVGEVDCIPVSSWVYPQEREKGFYDYSLAKDMLPWFIKNIGPYPYRKLANVQAKTVFGGMENASAIFYFENSITGDRKLESLLAHEIAHQWFGNSATETSWSHVWLSEGFATYMTHLYLEEKYGPDSLKKRMADDRQKVIDFESKTKTPVVTTTVTNNFMQLLNPNSYEKGGWVLHMLRRKIGDEKFWKGIRNYYAEFAGRNASTEDFVRVMQVAAGVDLQKFFAQWLYSDHMPALKISNKYDAATRMVTVTVEQTQPTLFEFPLQILIWSGSDQVTKSSNIKERVTTIVIPSESAPTRVVVDPNLNLLYR